MPMAPSVPRDGAADFLILPVMTAVAMKVFLDELPVGMTANTSS